MKAHSTCCSRTASSTRSSDASTAARADIFLVQHRGRRGRQGVPRPPPAELQAQRRLQRGPRRTQLRTQRASTRSRFGRQASDEEWGTTEARALHRLEAHGVGCPSRDVVRGRAPHGAREGRRGAPAPRLIEVRYEPEARAAYHDLRSQIVKMLCAEVVHGDPSAYNILAAEAGPTIIDFRRSCRPRATARGEFFFCATTATSTISSRATARSRPRGKTDARSGARTAAASSRPSSSPAGPGARGAHVPTAAAAFTRRRSMAFNARVDAPRPPPRSAPYDAQPPQPRPPEPAAPLRGAAPAEAAERTATAERPRASRGTATERRSAAAERARPHDAPRPPQNGPRRGPQQQHRTATAERPRPAGPACEAR